MACATGSRSPTRLPTMKASLARNSVRLLSGVPGQIASSHRESPGRNRRRIKPHRKLQIRRTELVDLPGWRDDTPAVPGSPGAKHQPGHAIEHLHPPLDAGGDSSEHKIRPHAAVCAHKLRCREHNAPDDQIDDHLFGRTKGPFARPVSWRACPDGRTAPRCARSCPRSKGLCP
jgi:hypothetical protein